MLLRQHVTGNKFGYLKLGKLLLNKKLSIISLSHSRKISFLLYVQNTLPYVLEPIMYKSCSPTKLIHCMLHATKV